jgi:hypothetical protein
MCPGLLNSDGFAPLGKLLRWNHPDDGAKPNVSLSGGLDLDTPWEAVMETSTAINE